MFDWSIIGDLLIALEKIVYTFSTQPKYVNAYDFIFSHQPKYRISRHIVFWIACWIFYLCTYFIPVICFPAWKIQGVHLPLVEQLGFSRYSLISLVFSARFMALQVLFTYILIYFLMPKYLIKEKYLSLSIAIVVLMFAVVMLSAYINYNTQPFIYGLFGVTPPNLGWSVFFFRSLDNILFNLPTTGGIALVIKLFKYWYNKKKEEQQLITSKANAELQLLKAQVHPHFLFNTLNNIYSFILTSSPRASEMIKKLSGLLRYIIYECNQPVVSLDKEFKMIYDYMSLEKIRYGEQMDMTTDIQGDYKNKTIAPLLLIPFVENSFKHGASKMLAKPWVSLNIIVETGSVRFMLDNSKPEEFIHPNAKNGIGLANVQKRLQLLYPGKHELKMTSGPKHFTVLLRLDLASATEKQESNILERQIYHHEMA